MRGAVAAGHRLTAEAGAQVLADGGNAVDACIAAAFVSWVTESPLTGPGAGGFMLVHRASDRVDARARPLRHRPGPRPAARRDASDGRGGGRLHARVVADLPDRAGLLRGAGGRGRARRGAPPLRDVALARAARAGDRARARGRRAERAAGLPARDPRPDPAAHRRGPRDVRLERQPPRRGRPARDGRPRRDARAAGRAGRRRPLQRRARAGALRARARAAAARSRCATWPSTA